MGKKIKQEDIQRIIYWVRRYEGLRDPKHDKIWLAKDMDLLERRIKEYFQNPKKFNFAEPDMGIEW